MTRSKTGYLACSSYDLSPDTPLPSNYFDLGVDDDNDQRQEPAAFMAVRVPVDIAKRLDSLDGTRTAPRPVSVTQGMEWTFPEGEGPPEGSDRKFEVGALKGRTFIDVTLEHPEHYFTARKSKAVPAAVKEYVAWIEKHFDVDVEHRKLKQVVVAKVSASSTSCSHSKVHHKGSSARFIRTTCVDCL